VSRQVARDEFGPWVVLTVYVGDPPDGRYETRVCRDMVRQYEYKQRYDDQDEALRGHTEVVAQVRAAA
jgi:hypothetical protein